MSRTFHQLLHEVCPLKRGREDKPNKTLSLKEPSSVVTSLLSAVFAKEGIF
jgi:hypothetical protein